MMPGTKPPPAIWTFLKVYGSAAAAPAFVALVTACTATTVAAATTAAAKALVSLLRIKGSLTGGRRISGGARTARDIASVPWTACARGAALLLPAPVAGNRFTYVPTSGQ